MKDNSSQVARGNCMTIGDNYMTVKDINGNIHLHHVPCGCYDIERMAVINRDDIPHLYFEYLKLGKERIDMIKMM